MLKTNLNRLNNITTMYSEKSISNIGLESGCADQENPGIVQLLPSAAFSILSLLIMLTFLAIEYEIQTAYLTKPQINRESELNK